MTTGRASPAADDVFFEGRKDKRAHLTMDPLYLVRLAGIEPTTPWFVAKYSIQLSYSREKLNYSTSFAQNGRGAPKNFLETPPKLISGHFYRPFGAVRVHIYLMIPA